MSSNPEPPVSRDPRRLRIGYAERDAVIETLREAAGQGRITTDELEERIEAADAARTYLELDPIVADLPTPPPSAQVAGQQLQPSIPAQRIPGQVPMPGQAGAPGYSAADPLVLNAGWNDQELTGDWKTVPFMRIKLSASTVHLDFTRVRNTLGRIDIEVEGAAGTGVIVVPEGWGVDVDAVAKSWGSKKSTVNRQPEPGQPAIVVTGSLGMSSLRVRHPNRWERRKLG
ncbi:DUF1707 domain-containing protein [Brevibacterium sp. 91QC2O2]|jgi:hypothetical protein|uniref:DUF1707 SHOCT-like domain-containing protein n=1 Tax=Brevibacterium TaxID=1696 RepID=UPI00211C0B87|nr:MULTISPECIES: DUF1707 domain-containing protein [unclassified Brevibacterium]MCQ9368589.1 DUF1707 domain-containing protein [Brevibacterium sp. 91QC2O2]MCQ9385317.1 DUF1707 domain-containing protein [Brevibacterium sp. 68QC2CO]